MVKIVENIKLKDRNGVEIPYNNVNTVTLVDQNGNEVVFKGTINLQNKTVSENGPVTCDSGFDGLGTVTVSLPNYDGAVVQNG